MLIKPKLYLNVSPETVEEGGLVFAKNMKVDNDGYLVSDYGYNILDTNNVLSGYTILGHIVGLDDSIYLFCYNANAENKSVIFEYNEKTNAITALSTKWSCGSPTYLSACKITGAVTTNISGEKILTIGEYYEGHPEIKIPLKHINLSFANVKHESLYCQAPVVPITNLIFNTTYTKTIPNGTYVFFIRYKIRTGVYTKWYLCSRPCFAGTSEVANTLQGGVEYINKHKDSARSFIFNIEHLNTAAIAYYQGFQLGFIITHDEATDARIWKEFEFSANPNSQKIYFDYEVIQETNIDDLLEPTYELYNVKNITSYKNKLYISNYVESDLNPDITSLSNPDGILTNDDIQLGYTIQNFSNNSNIEVKVGNTSLTYNSTTKTYGNSSEKSTVLSNISKQLSTLFKEGNRVDEKAATIGMGYHHDNDPDYVVVNKVNNKLYSRDGQNQQINNYIFGGNYDKDITLVIPTWSTNQGRYYTQKTNTEANHPFRTVNTLPVGYGCVLLSNDNDTGDPTDFDKLGATEDSYSVYPFFYGRGGTNYICRDNGISAIGKTLISQHLTKLIGLKGKSCIEYIEFYSGTDVYAIGKTSDFNEPYFIKNSSQGYDELYSVDELQTDTISSDTEQTVDAFITSIISDRFVGISKTGMLVLTLGGKNIPVSTCKVVFRKYEFKPTRNDVENSDAAWYVDFDIDCNITTYSCVCDLNINNLFISGGDNSTFEQMSSLMPLSQYKIYIHGVDEHNIITNGYVLPFNKDNSISGHSNIQLPPNPRIGNVVPPADNIILNIQDENLPSLLTKHFYFISIEPVGDLIIEGFAYTFDNTRNKSIINSIELDSLLFNINDNIIVYGLSITGSTKTLHWLTDTGKYYSSGNSTPVNAFGNCGFIMWDSNIPEQYDRYYIVQKRNITNDNPILIKATPYLSLGIADINPVNIYDGFYGAYSCNVRKPSYDLGLNCYVAGSDIYAAKRTTTIKLEDFNSLIQQVPSENYNIVSLFNLNYLSLTEDINDKLFAVGSASSGIKQVAKVINSALLSYIYELNSMYREFRNKTFKAKQLYSKTVFDNTIRVSNVLSDETFNNDIFRFTPVDYYNVPTDRGIIISLFSIGNNIYVHTRYSFYKFDGNQTISASKEDIQLTESEPFETGIVQLFDSQYGYGGIDKKESGCVTFDSYFFYDRMSNHIFGYKDNQPILIDAAIYKFLEYYKPVNCRVVHDTSNNRVLFEFITSQNLIFTLSYNYKSKSFVSLHDLTLEKAFNSRKKVYSYKTSFISLFENNTIDSTVVSSDFNILKLYGDATLVSKLHFGDNINNKIQLSPFTVSVIAFPKNSILEAINNLKYIGKLVKAFIASNVKENVAYNTLFIPQVLRENPVTSLYIITDRCISNLIDSTINDAQRVNPLTDYKGFKYDKGSWNASYIRDILNTDDIYDYKDPNNTRVIQGDNNSLVYGKYFIVTFNFITTSRIKIEELIISSQTY